MLKDRVKRSFWGVSSTFFNSLSYTLSYRINVSLTLFILNYERVLVKHYFYNFVFFWWFLSIFMPFYSVFANHLHISLSLGVYIAVQNVEKMFLRSLLYARFTMSAYQKQWLPCVLAAPFLACSGRYTVLLRQCSHVGLEIWVPLPKSRQAVERSQTCAYSCAVSN